MMGPRVEASADVRDGPEASKERLPSRPSITCRTTPRLSDPSDAEVLPVRRLVVRCLVLRVRRVGDDVLLDDEPSLVAVCRQPLEHVVDRHITVAEAAERTPAPDRLDRCGLVDDRLD